MRRCRIEIEIVLLDVFAVIAFVAGQSEQPLLEDRIFAVPEGESKTDVLVPVGDSARCRLHPNDKRGCAHARGEGSPRRPVGL